MIEVAQEIKTSSAQLAWIQVSRKLKRCPVYRCTRTYRSKDGLGTHLFKDHRRNQLIAVILDLLGL